MSAYPAPGDDPLTFRDLWEILSLPVSFDLVAIVVTWLVWYFTSGSCPQDLAQTTGCNASRIAWYVNLEVLNKVVAHAAIAAGGGGLWSYAVITRERRAREAAERQLAEERARANQERAQAAAREEQLRAEAAEERTQATEERRQFLALIENLTERLDGNGRSPSQ